VYHGRPVRLLLASLLLFTACAHAPSAVGPEPAPPAPATPAETTSPSSLSSEAERSDRFAPVRAAAEALLEAQGQAAWRAWTSGEPTDQAAIWKGREALLDPAVLAHLAEAIAAAPMPQRSRLERLRAFLLGEQLARATAEPTQALASARSAASFAWEKRTVSLRQLHALLAGEPEGPRRKAAAEAWQAAVLKLEKRSAARDAALLRAGAERGFGGSLALAGALRLDEPDRLRPIAEATLAAGDAAWSATLDALARRELGSSGSRLREYDLPRLFRTTASPGAFPADRLVADVAEILAGLGLDLSAGGKLTVDAALRPGKLTRPLAVPVEVPGQIRLSLTPLAGLDAVRALLHEVGVGLSLAHVAPTAPFEDRRLPPAWHTQAWGLLFEEIASNPDWLRAHGLSPEAAQREADLDAGRLIHATRAAAATVLIELVRAQDPASAAARWAELGPRALGHPIDRRDPPPWRLDPDPLLRAADTLRAHLLARQLSASLAALAGDRPWWRSPAAGDWLRRAWAHGGGWVPATTSAPP
jgi:hypothetical protein